MATLRSAASSLLDASVEVTSSVGELARTGTGLVKLGSNRVNSLLESQKIDLVFDANAHKIESELRFRERVVTARVKADTFRSKSKLHAKYWDEVVVPEIE